MKKLMKKLAFVLVMIVSMSPSSAIAMELPMASQAEIDSGEGPAVDYEGYIVKLEDVQDSAVVAQIPGTDVLIGDLVVVEDLATLQDVAEEADIEWVEPNYFVELFSGSEPYPNDPYYTDAIDYQWNLKAIDMVGAWGSGLFGNDTTIAVIDSGLVSGHEDINYENIISGQNFNADALSYSTDNTGHGSFIVGVMAAQLNNGKGLAGISPSTKIMPLRCFNSDGASVSTVIAAIDYAIAQQVDIINMSFGTSYYSTYLRDACDRAAAAGIILTAAVGNMGGSGLMYPAAFDSVIGVGSVDNNLGSYTVSSYSQQNESVFVTAPAGGVISIGTATPGDYELDYMDNSNKGTSYAAPVVASLAALAKGRDSNMSPDTFKNLIRETSVDLGVVGYDVAYGHGMVNSSRMAAALAHDYTVEYTLNDGLGPTAVISGAYPTVYSLTSDEVILPVPTRAGYIFGGWYDTADFSGSAIEKIAEGTVGDLTFTGSMVSGGFHFYAKWQAIAVNTAPIRLADQTVQIGTAIPASYDGQTEAVVFTTDAALWFNDAQTADVLTYKVEDTIDSEKISFSGSDLTFTPDIADAGRSVVFQIYAYDGFEASTPAVLTISVGSVPASNAILSPETATYDLYSGDSRHVDIVVDLLTYNNTLDGIYKQEGWLTFLTDYTVSYDNLMGEALIKASYLSGLPVGTYALTFDFSEGSDSSLLLTVVDSTPTASEGDDTGVTDDTGDTGDTGGGSSGGDATVVAEISTVIKTTFEEMPTVIPYDEVEIIPQQQSVTQMFDDIDQGSWYLEAVQFVYSHGLFKGVSGSRFAPDENVSRAMFVTVLSRLAAIDSTQFTTNSFADVQADAWYGPAVGWAATNALVGGYSPQIFGSQDYISREQMVLILYRYAGWAGLKLNVLTEERLSDYQDVAVLSPWAFEAMTWAVSSGIINGKQGNCLDPQGMTTRAEVAAILQRFARIEMTE